MLRHHPMRSRMGSLSWSEIILHSAVTESVWRRFE
jgi:hypothetical protein